MPATRAELLAFLDDLGIASTTHDHEAVFTVSESTEVHDRMPGGHTKNLFLKDKKGRIFLVVALHDAEIDLKSLHQKIGAQGRLSFGKPDLLMEVLGVEPSPGGSGSDGAGGDGGGEGGASAADADITLCFEAEPTPFWSAANPDANGRPRCFDWHRRGMCRAGATCCFSHL